MDKSLELIICINETISDLEIRNNLLKSEILDGIIITLNHHLDNLTKYFIGNR